MGCFGLSNFCFLRCDLIRGSVGAFLWTLFLTNTCCNFVNFSCYFVKQYTHTYICTITIKNWHCWGGFCFFLLLFYVCLFHFLLLLLFCIFFGGVSLCVCASFEERFNNLQLELNKNWCVLVVFVVVVVLLFSVHLFHSDCSLSLSTGCRRQ